MEAPRNLLLKRLQFFLLIASVINLCSCSLNSSIFGGFDALPISSPSIAPKLNAPILKTEVPSTITSESPILNWDPVDSADRYEVRVFKTMDDSAASAWITSTSGTRLTGLSLNPGESYYAKVRAMSSSDIGKETQSPPWRAATSGKMKSWGDDAFGQLGDGFIYNSFSYPTVPVTAPTPFTSLVLTRDGGSTHSACGLTASGAIHCWTDTTAGTLGNGTTDKAMEPVEMPGGITFSQIANGGQHFCALTALGASYCWGSNDFSNLGNGGTASSTTPVATSGGHLFSQISGGHLITCGLKSDGSVYCWGLGIYGGNTPTQVPGGFSFTQIAVGEFHGCGLDSAGDAFCWGNNQYSQFGNASGGSVTPTAVLGGHTYSKIFAGGNQTCGLATNGDLYCWGSHESSTAFSTTPMQIDPGVKFNAVSTGYEHICAISTGGVLKCWGLNRLGALGVGDYNTHLTPQPVLTGALTFTAVETGRDSTCALATGGDWYCWGTRNAVGFNSLTPKATFPSLTIARASTSGEYTCVLDSLGNASCWGANYLGQLGDNSIIDKTAPVSVAGGHTFAQISAYSVHTCALTTAGEAYCWGLNDYGQLGVGAADTNDRLIPTRVAGSQLFRSIHVAQSNTCAIDFSNLLYCWGEGFDTIPTLFATPSSVASMTLASRHACYLDLTGAAWCMGFNGNGSLGNGTTTNSNSFVRVSGAHTFFEITSGFDFSCGLVKNGDAYCWGSLYDGLYLGGGSPTGSMAPVPVSGGLQFSKIASGETFTCGRTISGDDFCWGNNYMGQLGDLTTTDRNVPTAVDGVGKIIDIFTGSAGYSLSIF